MCDYDYSFYCTKEQTKKALELGAPICCIRNGVQQKIKPPTAEQMIGWLEEQGIHIYAHKIYVWSCHCYLTCVTVRETKNYSTILQYDHFFGKEAILTAINAALEYLETHKE